MVAGTTMSPIGRTIAAGAARVTVVVTVVALAVAGAGVGGPARASGSSPVHSDVVGAASRTLIERAFSRLVSPYRSLASQRRYIQGDDSALADALQSAYGTGFGAGGGVTTLSEVFGVLRRASATVVTVPVVFTDPSLPAGKTALRHYVGTAVRVGGRWKVSWATACTIVEASDIVCPRAPTGVSSTVPPPSYDPAAATAPLLAAGLIDPTGLAAGPQGSLYIADDGRDQVLRRSADGRLAVVAGTGLSGFSGDGGPAVDAALDLDGPTSVAVAPDGALYIADTANDRVRMVGTDGIITTVAGDGTPGDGGNGGPAADAPLERPTGLALGPDGGLYIADGTAVRKVAPDGIITTVAGGGPPYDVDVGGDGAPVAFSPESLAFDGAGDLDVYSDGPKMIFQLPAGPDGPSGDAITVIAPHDDATGLASAPDGSVVVAEHGAALERLAGGRLQTVYDFLDTSVAGYGVPGLKGAFSPQGVAVTPDGTVDADTGDGNGWSPQIALIQLPAGGHAAVLPVVGPVTDSLPSVGGPGFPAATYPAAVAARPGAGISACPAPSGLRDFDRAARATAVSEAEQLDDAFPEALTDTDRSWWTSTYDQWADPTGLGRHAVGRVVPAAKDLYAPVVARACGDRTVTRSLVVVVGRSAYSTEVSHIYFVDRGGRPLVYYQNA